MNAARLATPALLASLGLAHGRPLDAQAGSVRFEQKIGEVSGGFGGALDGGDRFGGSVAALGDLDGDGVGDLAVGAPLDDDGVFGGGAVWILFLNRDGSVRDQSKISATSGGFGGDLDPQDLFGESLAAIGDLDEDGVPDLAVGAIRDDSGGQDRGAIWILFLNADGTVKGQRRLAQGFGLGIALRDFDRFATSLAAIGDLDGDGIPDLAAGTPFDGPVNQDVGAIWILFLDADGTVRERQKINSFEGGFGGDLRNGDLFGESIAPVGDLDGDGTMDLAVGAIRDDTAGAVWILFLNPDGTVHDEQKISRLVGGFGGALGSSDQFGISVAGPGDLDGDDVPDLAVGANHDSSSGRDQGSVWICFLNGDGTVHDQLRIAENAGGFEGSLDAAPTSTSVGDQFGWSLATLGDQDGDGAPDLAVGAHWANGGHPSEGAAWILFLESPGRTTVRLDFETEDDGVTPLGNGQHLDTEFGFLATLSSSGPNAGLAIFDSTPGGPNDPSQDPDLLIDTGNLLILQTENLPPDAGDVFPRPNDDADGGTISLAFPQPVEVRSLALVDIDQGGAMNHVRLTDASARTRTHAVPGNWTGDHALGEPGRGKLELLTLFRQDGLGSTATAGEDAGFDPTSVVRLDVELADSGALDDVEISVAAPAARVRVRNGSGVNPIGLTAANGPVLGRPWTTELACPSAPDGGLGLLLVCPTPVAELLPWGERLVAGPRLHRMVRPLSLARTSFPVAVPRDLSLAGQTVHVQALCRPAGTTPVFTNALELVLGL